VKAPPTLAAFEEYIRAVEQRLRAGLQEIRAQLHHSGNKGSLAESAFRQALGRFLPRTLGLGHGEIIDTRGTRSAQCDLVIATDRHPNWFNEDDAALFLVEAVAGAAEVKAQLTSDHLTTAIDNCKRFRALKPNWGREGNTEVVGADEDVKRFYRSPPYFLFAYESQLSIETIGERVSGANECERGRVGEGIDGVFVLDRGYVLNFGYGSGAVVAQGDDGDRLMGYYHDDKEPLLMLLRWLPLCLAIPQTQLPVLSQYVLGDVTSPKRGS
jgi:hypothetical protein